MSESMESGVVATLARGWAADVAASGDFERAEKILSGLAPEAQATPEVLDLRARMLAQQKRFREAAALWRQAIRLSPERAEYEAALALCEKLEGRPKWFAFPREGAVAAVVLVALLGTLIVVARPGEMKPQGRNAQEAREAPGILSSAPSSSAGSPSNGAPPAVDGRVVPVADLHIAGVRSSQGASALTLTFEAPLFGRSARLLPGEGERVRDVGRALQVAGSDLVIEVVGHTDAELVPDGSRFPDNAALALSRAVVVAEELRRECGLPAGNLRSRIGQPEERPWPDAADRRNRAVSLVVSRRAAKG